jgi:class 3 adenylate cyclase
MQLLEATLRIARLQHMSPDEERNIITAKGGYFMPDTLQKWAGTDQRAMTTLALAFTDIVGSTDLAKKFGDQKWLEILMEHFRQARRFKDECHGYEIKLIGDAYMAAFRTAADAFQFAWLFYNATWHEKIQLRIGIHVGQVRIVEDDIYGGMVNYASRVQHSLSGLGIMLSDGVRNDVVNELGEELSEVSLIRVRKQIKSFGTQYLWFVSKKLTPIQESTFGKFLKVALFNEFDHTPPAPGDHKGKIGL